MSSGPRSDVPHGTWRRRKIEWQVLSLYEGVKTLLRPSMVFHIPPALRVYGKFTVAVSETALVTETGCEQLGTFPRALASCERSESSVFERAQSRSPAATAAPGRHLIVTELLTHPPTLRAKPARHSGSC